MQTMLEGLCAAHLSTYVHSDVKDCGGMMLVGDPATLRSTMLSVIDRQYHNALTLSDVNARTLAELRGQIASRNIRTLVLPEFAKLYERGNPGTAENVVGTLRAMVAEGFHAPSFEDARIARTVARCLVLAAITPTLRGRHFNEWEDSGFNRRFLWPLLTLENGDILEESRVQRRLLEIECISYPPIPNAGIPDQTTEAERRALRVLVKYQPGGNHAIQLELLIRMLAVLRWWYPKVGRAPEEAMVRVREFARTLGKHGAFLVVEMMDGDTPRTERPHKILVPRRPRRRKGRGK
jgi:hypothetical protein